MQRMPAHKSVIAATLLGLGLPFLAQRSLRSAQTPVPPRLQPMRVPDKFTNLQVLPKGLSREHLLALMNQYSGQLGVRCSFCHVLNPATGHADFASDAKPEKQAARVMIRMAATVNARFLARLPGSIRTEQKVSCYTCHRGHPRPEKKPEADIPPPDI